MKRSFVIPVALLILFAGGVFFVSKEKPLTPEVPAGVQTVEGTVQEVAERTRVVTITTGDKRTLLLALHNATQIIEIFPNNATRTLTLAEIRPGFPVRATGEFSKTDTVIPSKLEMVNVPNIIVHIPKPDVAVGLPLVIMGEARTFESNVLARVVDADGTVLAETFTTASAPDVGYHGPFEFRMSYRKPNSSTGRVEVYEGSAKDGSEINKVVVPIRFASVEAMEVKVYFPNEKKMGLECEATYPVVRRIAKTAAPARAALEELLKGPDALDWKEGYSTAINGGVKIKSLVIEADGTAKVDFDAMMNAGVAGSCRVLAIHSQIRETLMQFPTVKRVVVSVEGNVEEALQP